ncbi:MAG: tyrosine-type recombinase/integrase, partial [Thermodesulfobacteriota bacterium]
MASLAYKHNSYYAVFSIKGKKKWIRIGRVDKKEAKKLLKYMELEHIKGRLEIKETEEILFYDYIDEYLKYSKTNKATTTYERELQAIKQLQLCFGNICLGNIDNKSIENYKSIRINQGLVPSSVNRELTVLSAMLKKAYQWNYTDKVPTFTILKLPKNPPKFLSVEETNKLLECSSSWLRPIFIVLRNTGMRIGEVLRLKHSDIDLDNNVILVRSLKTNNFRIVPINAEL